MHSLSERYPIQVLQGAKTTNAAALSTLSIPLRGLEMVRLVAILNQAVSHQTVLTPKLSTDAAGTSSDAITKVVPIYQAACGSAMPTKGTSALTITLAAGTGDQIAIFEIDPAVVVLSTAADHVYLGLYWSASSQATDFITVYAEAVPHHGLQAALALYA